MRTTSLLVSFVLVAAIGVTLAPGAAADHDGDPIPDSTEQTICNSPNGQLLDSMGILCDSGDLVISADPTVPQVPGLPGPDGLDADGDLMPDLVEPILCESTVLPSECMDTDEDGVAEDFRGPWQQPMSTVVDPACETLGDTAPDQVCILSFFTVGQTFCLLRGSGPANGAVLSCSGGSLQVSCGAGNDLADQLDQLYADADCDGHGNAYEAEHGCDPVDAGSFPTGNGECSAGADESLALGCTDLADPASALDQLYADADCDGHGNAYELQHGCNPYDPTEFPGMPGGCSMGEVPAPPV